MLNIRYVLRSLRRSPLVTVAAKVLVIIGLIRLMSEEPRPFL